MSFWDNVKKFAQPYAEDEYDDYDDEEEYVDDYEEPAQPARREKRRAAPAPAPAPVMDEEEEEEDEYGFRSMTPAAPAASTPASTGFTGTVLNRSGNKQEVVLFRPTRIADTTMAADDLRNRKAVIVNMESLDESFARRVVDILSGCVYALEGSVQKIAQATFLFCPKNMEIVGNLDALPTDVDAYV